jgi:hypothetical protein
MFRPEGGKLGGVNLFPPELTVSAYFLHTWNRHGSKPCTANLAIRPGMSDTAIRPEFEFSEFIPVRPNL